MLLRHGGAVLRLLRDAATGFDSDAFLETAEFVHGPIGQTMA